MSSASKQDYIIDAPVTDAQREILTPEALALVVALHHKFNGRRKELLAAREVRQKRIDQGERPDFLPETASVRAGDWKVAPIPADLTDPAPKSPAQSTAK